jgi:hypothetical protein
VDRYNRVKRMPCSRRRLATGHSDMMLTQDAYCCVQSFKCVRSFKNEVCFKTRPE